MVGPRRVALVATLIWLATLPPFALAARVSPVGAGGTLAPGLEGPSSRGGREVRISEADVEAARPGPGAARAARLPRPATSPGSTKTFATIRRRGDFDLPDSLHFDPHPGGRLPIFNGGRRTAEVQAARTPVRARVADATMPGVPGGGEAVGRDGREGETNR